MHLSDELNTNYKLAYVRTDNDVLADSQVSYGTFDNNFIYSNQLDYIQTINDGAGEPGAVTLVYAVTALFPNN